ncbi:cupin fold metalloprotein, WbuC family [Halomonas sp. DQ26W]|uniref:WbuC family cupin fold metalloprotein n=1 Tax=Halomonas sp. DQ26W TaxID=2282311 RepID=UPI000DF8150D|nr:WbuC family cupin fold metalloprotein [Halomonas sp. DQ26W]RDB41809.1 cupin fold metalloprotein, WbuC family [Halomonas sp. DQ26W]
MSYKILSEKLIDDLEVRAEQSLRGRQHHNIHESFEDPCQRLFNAISMESYIRPHRHSLDPKDECLVAVKGLFGLVVFSEEGTVVKVERFGTELYFGDESQVSLGVDLSAGTWHTVVALRPGAVLLEIKAGPFNPDAAKEFAPWAPEEGTKKAKKYLSYLKSFF